MKVCACTSLQYGDQLHLVS